MARQWLWPANAIGMLVIAAAAISQPVTMLSVPCDAPPGVPCDPHGYVAIFSSLPAGGVAILALIAFSLLVARSRVGFGAALAATGACAMLLVLFGPVLTGTVRWPIAVGTVAVAGLVLAGLRWAPERQRPRLAEPPYPPVR
jgi:hypothetical protein